MSYRLRTPDGYIGVEWADGRVHAIDLNDWPDGTPLWRSPVVCDSAGPGVSSDEGGPAAIHRSELNCSGCIGILA